MNQIVKKEEWQAAMDVASAQVDAGWHQSLFIIAKRYGRIGDTEEIENWPEEKLVALFNVSETALVYDTAQLQVLSDVHTAAGKALLWKLWNIYQQGTWVRFRPTTSTNDEDWAFGDYVSLAISGMGEDTTEDYHRKLAHVCERVFNWLKVNVVADIHGERIDAIYLIRAFGPYILIMMSQFFSKNPTAAQIKEMLADVLTSPSPATAIETHKARVDRAMLGTSENIFYMRELGDGAAAFHIVLQSPKHVKKLRKFLSRYGEERSWASENDVTDIPQEQS